MNSTRTETVDKTVEYQRLDLFLWHARFASQRNACAALAASGLVRINRVAVEKPHAKVRVGDILTVPLRARISVVRVVKLGERRGPPEVARDLYVELSAV